MAHFSALDGQQLLVIEGSGCRGRWEFDSQVFCQPPIQCMRLAFMDKHFRHTSCLHHHHHRRHFVKVPPSQVCRWLFLALAGSRCDGCTRQRRHRQCPPPERATPPLISSTCNGPSRRYAPSRLTGPEEGWGRGGGTS